MACTLTHEDAHGIVRLLRTERHSYYMLSHLAAYQLTLQHGLLHLLLHLLNLQLLNMVLLPKRAFSLLCLKQLEVDVNKSQEPSYTHSGETVRVQCLAKRGQSGWCIHWSSLTSVYVDAYSEKAGFVRAM